MKRLLEALCLAGAIAAGAAQAAPALELWNIPRDSEGALAGQVQGFELVAYGFTDALGAFSTDILYDPALVGFSGVRLAPNLGDPAVPEVLGLADGATPGVIHLTVVSLLSEADLIPLQTDPATGLLGGEFSLAIIEVRGLSGGIGVLALSDPSAATAVGDPIAGISTQDTPVLVSEPSLLALVGLGMPGLFARRRKNRGNRGGNFVATA